MIHPFRKHTRRVLLGALAATSLWACNEEGCPTAKVCDIRELSCQQSVMRAVSCMRGGKTQLPAVKVVSQADLVARYAEYDAEQTEQERLDYRAWTRGLSLFHLAPNGYDQESARADTAAEIAAVYYRDTKEIWIVDRGQPMNNEQSIELFAHELVHALQDADYDLQAYRERWVTDYDSSLAIRALIEGEAVHYQALISIQFASFGVHQADWEGWYREWRRKTLLEAEKDPAPVALAGMRFPYAFGGGFVTQHWLARGRAGIDALIDHPPLTTREIMFGALPTDVSADPESFQESAVPELQSDSRLVDASALGAWITRMFSARAGRPVSERLTAASALLHDTFSVQAESASDNVVAAWRVRLQPGQSTAAFPGLNLSSLHGWTETSDVFLLAGSQSLNMPQSLAWVSPSQLREEPDETTASPSSPQLRLLGPDQALSCSTTHPPISQHLRGGSDGKP